MTTANATLNAKLISLVHTAQTNPTSNSAEYLHEMLRSAEERRDRIAAQRIRLAIHHAERVAG